MYSFLWEQDVTATFSQFLAGQAPPHPRRFTRPETVRSRASARAHSGRPRRCVCARVYVCVIGVRSYS